MRHFVVAESLKQARNSAEIDWNWEPLSRTSWREPGGEEARYVSDARNLHGYERGQVTIHCGYRWYENPQLAMLTELCKSRDYKMVTH